LLKYCLGYQFEQNEWFTHELSQVDKHEPPLD